MGSIRTINKHQILKNTKKTLLITGASSGIGMATVMYFQQKGWNVIAAIRKPENETKG